MSPQSGSPSQRHVWKMQWPLAHLNCQSWQLRTSSHPCSTNTIRPQIRFVTSSSLLSGQSWSPSQRQALGRQAPPAEHCSCVPATPVSQLAAATCSKYRLQIRKSNFLLMQIRFALITNLICPPETDRAVGLVAAVLAVLLHVALPLRVDALACTGLQKTNRIG